MIKKTAKECKKASIKDVQATGEAFSPQTSTLKD